MNVFLWAFLLVGLVTAFVALAYCIVDQFDYEGRPWCFISLFLSVLLFITCLSSLSERGGFEKADTTEAVENDKAD